MGTRNCPPRYGETIGDKLDREATARIVDGVMRWAEQQIKTV